jgi:phosphatidate cytidylyltransferase
MNNVLTRAISGVIYVALIVCATLNEVLFPILTLIFVVLGTYEYQNICQSKQGYKIPITHRALDMIAAIATWSFSTTNVGVFYSKPIFMVSAFVLVAYFIAKFVLAVFDTTSDSFSNIARSFLGWLYVATPLAMLNMLSVSNYHSLILPMFVLIWINDTGAFCVGSLMGKHRLCERLSPKKSWEGFYGGLAFCVIAAIAYSLIVNVPIGQSIAFAIIVSVFSTIGDLFESMLKRSAGVKDSGNIIPGHGGILDRIDSLLFVAPTILLAITFYTVL